MGKDIDILELELRKREAGIEFLRELEKELRKQSGECTEKIKEQNNLSTNYGDEVHWTFSPENKKRIILDDAISKAYGLIQFLTKEV